MNGTPYYVRGGTEKLVQCKYRCIKRSITSRRSTLNGCLCRAFSNLALLNLSHLETSFVRFQRGADSRWLVPDIGLEPILSYENRILSPERLPFRQSGSIRFLDNRKPKVLRQTEAFVDKSPTLSLIRLVPLTPSTDCDSAGRFMAIRLACET